MAKRALAESTIDNGTPEATPELTEQGARFISLLEKVDRNEATEEEIAELKRADADGSLQAAIGDQAEKFKALMEKPAQIEKAALPEEVKVAAQYTADVIRALEKVPAERRELALAMIARRVEERNWKRSKKVQLERLDFLVQVSRQVSEELSGEDVRIPEGVSQMFGRKDLLGVKGAGSVVENTEYAASTGVRLSIGFLEWGVSATAFLSIFKALGFAVAQWSPLHFVAIAAAGALVPLAEAAKETAVGRFVGRHPISVSTVALASFGAVFAVGNSATFLQSFGESDQSADTVGSMTRAINAIRTDLDRVRVDAQDTTTSDLEGKVTEAQAFFERMIRAEAGGQSEHGIGGSGREGVGPNTAVKVGITGVRPAEITVPDALRNRPEVQARIRAARERINARMRAIDPQYELRPGESIPQALDRYLQAFGESSATEFRALEGYRDAAGAQIDRGEYGDLMDLAHRIEENAEPVRAKLNTATAQPTEGAPDLELAKAEIREVLASLSTRVQEEVSIPIRTLFEAVSDEMNALGDPEDIELQVPAFNPNTSLLDQVEIPRGRGLQDPELYRTILIEKFGEKGVWVLLFTLFAFSGIGWSYAQGRRLKKKQDPIFSERIKDMMGEDVEGGIEIAYAQKTAERFAGELGAVDGLLQNEGVKALLPFGADLSWFELSPLEVMVAWREGAAKADRNLDTEKKSVLQKIADVYAEGLEGTVRLAPESKEVRALNKYLDLLRNEERRTLAVQEAALPGFSKLIGMSQEIARIAHDSSPEKTSAGTREKVREFQAALLKMSFDHIAFRARISHTTISLLKTTYDQLRQKGEFRELDVVGLTELPRDISFDLLSNSDLPENLTSELLRGSALRSVTINALERRMDAEQKKLREMEHHLQKLLDVIQALPGKAGATDPSFIELAALVRAELEKAKKPFAKHKNEKLDLLTTSGGIEDLLLKEVRAATRGVMRENTDEAVEHDARDQISSIRRGLRGFADSIVTPGYQSSVRLERKARGDDDDSVADYLAVVIQVRRNGGSVVADMEFPLRNVLGKGTSPDISAETFERWSESTRNYFLLSQKYDDAERKVEQAIAGVDVSRELSKEGSLPDITLNDRASDRRIEEFYTSFLPARSKHLLLYELRAQLIASKEEFTNRRSRRVTDKDYNNRTERLNSILYEVDKASSYTYDFTNQRRRVAHIAETVRSMRGVRVILKPFDPVRVGLDQEEVFTIEDGSTFAFARGGAKRKQLTLDELERAIERGATTYQDLVKNA
ncbi:MAG TPA: hypothetical protein VEB18_00500 [Candidatus Paceibacterota bacterium]|nr:hypothetical protein [Candidatus Paceibacterota bacterium]